MLISLTPEKFAAAVQKLKSAPQSEVKSFTCDGNSGMIDTSQVDLNYRYNGVDTLDVQIAAKHGLVRFASDGEIQKRIVALLDAE